MTTTKLDMLELYEMSMEEMKEKNGGQQTFEEIAIIDSNYRPHIAHAASEKNIKTTAKISSFFTLPTLIENLVSIISKR